MRTRRRAIFFPLLGASAALLLSGASLAGHLDDRYEADSEITLVEKAGGQKLTVSVVTSDGRTTLTSDRSGSPQTTEIAAGVCSALWEDLLALPIDELESAAPKPAWPDSSEFTLTLRVGATSHSLTVYDVDSLDDARYRNAIRAILDLDSAHSAPAEG